MKQRRSLQAQILADRAGWNTLYLFRKASSSVGAVGLASACAVLTALAAWVWEMKVLEEVARLRSAAAERVQVQEMSVAAAPADVDMGRISKFEQTLLSHSSLPSAMQDIFLLAEAEGIVLKQGEYRQQEEPAGGFVRHRMSLPVTGDSMAIQRFMLRSLEQQRALALEGLHFKRESGSATSIEAQLDWVLFIKRSAPPVLNNARKAGRGET